MERIWRGDDMVARVARLALAPAEGLYRGVVAARGALYDLGLLPARRTALPSISVGNLSVGGTGKTPVSAHIAARLRDLGGKPAIVLRGYGGDEPLVHATLNPSVPVVVSPDRVAGVARARVLGADVAVLDDAFQHRRAQRSADIVLVSTESWTDQRRLLPAGPWREPLRALRRATLAIVTRKAASSGAAAAVSDALRRAVPSLQVAIVALLPDELRDARGTGSAPLAVLAGKNVHAIAAIADPRSFVAQLEQAGAARVTPSVFPDHYEFTDGDARRLALEAPDADIVVCTLKDAVKLAPHWPAEASRLWYVSQHVVVEQGSDLLDTVLDALLAARSTY
ncbi:MAG TPA: tetraacyldisaccharide 4'-kinase [Gemmatimonadaceae bacterium]|nr:tetraacyldisaccharide 4'-kinase [Gemmatimonadaceae bacterium]